MGPDYRPSVAASETEQGSEGEDARGWERPTEIAHEAHRIEGGPVHPKLVRDKIPQIIRRSGAEPQVRVAEGAEYAHLLREKLREEVAEFLESDDPDELADVLEVLLALAVNLGLDRDDLEKRRVAKAEERGGFADRIVWYGSYRPGVSP